MTKNRKKGLTYDQFMEYAKEHYTTGGDAYYECWEEKEFNYYVENFGEITKKKALSMFRLEYALQTERENFFSH